jgi:hypothetical protein
MNWSGLDEWLILEVAGRGIVSVPYAYRPLGLIWALGPAWLAPAHGFAVFRLFYALYALLSAALVFHLARRVWPQRPLLATLIGCLCLAWSPSDMARLSCVDSAVYQGITLGALLAIALLVGAWRRQSLPLVGVAALVAFASIRCYEGSGALLAAAPVLLPLLTPRASGPGRFVRFVAIWEAAIASAFAFFLLELLVSRRHDAYQLSVLGVHPSPAGWLARLLRQYALHLSPLVTWPAGELLTPAVPAALTAFVLALQLAPWHAEPELRGRRSLLAGCAAGLLLAALGYGVALVGVSVPTAFRLEFLSGPGIAVFLACAILLLASLLPLRAGGIATALLGAWVVAVGAGRMGALQRDWELLSFASRQRQMLSEMVRVVPDVAPHTLLVLLDEKRDWNGAFSFHHAVQYLYERRAAGHVPGRADTLYAAIPDPGGIRFEPLPIVRLAWDEPGSLYRYEEVVVLRSSMTGALAVLAEWPRELAPLPAAAVYAPAARIRRGPSPRAAILSD